VPMTPGRGFLVNCPSVTCYWLPEGKTWEFLVFVGDMGRWHVDQLLTTTIERAVRFIEWTRRWIWSSRRKCR